MSLALLAVGRGWYRWKGVTGRRAQNAMATGGREERQRQRSAPDVQDSESYAPSLKDRRPTGGREGRREGRREIRE